MDRTYEEFKPPVREVAQQYEQKRRSFQALHEAARMIPKAINKRYAKQQWCKAAIQYLKVGRKA